jgi:predicted TIM-barrel fold metal-dependent hydrolase
MTTVQKRMLVSRMRQIGFDRLLFGSDGATPGHGPREQWASIESLPLTDAERRALATNVAPYMR